VLPSVDMLVGYESEPRFCSLVLADEIFRQNGAAGSLKLEK